jgi:hypothetical protein
MIVALVTGGRTFWPTQRSLSDIVVALADVALVVEGDASGFDAWVRDQARARRIAVQPVPSLWGVARAQRRPVGCEGPRRNARMLRWGKELADEYKLRLVLIAGPGGTGTADMRSRCSALDVREVGI